MSGPNPAPTYATAPTPGAPNDLHAIQVTAKALGTPLMPWQSLVSRVASERLPSDPRRFRYPIVVITVPRQSGKTTLMRAVLTQRALVSSNRKAFYTAQTGKDAAARWNDLVKQIEQGPFAQHVKKRMAAGSQSLTFPTGSTISPFAPTAKSLHGYTPHDVMLDEVFAHTAAQGEDLMGAIKPAQITLADRQLWLVSTMGTAESEFLHSWVAQGRAAVNDPAANVAYFEWSLPDDLDAYDPRNWAFHPAVGHTITVDDLAEAAATHSPGEWNRAYMNRRSTTSESWLNLPAFDQLAGPQEPPAWAEVSVAFDVAHDRSKSAIWASWLDAAGVVQIRPIRTGAGTDWLAGAVANIWVERRPLRLLADDAGQVRPILDQLRLMPNPRSGANGIEVETLGAKDWATACAHFKALAEDGAMGHDGDAGLRQDLTHAVARPLGEGSALSRARSTGPIPNLVAAVVAVRGITTAPAPAPAPKVYIPQ